MRKAVIAPGYGVPPTRMQSRQFRPYNVAETVAWFSPRAGLTNVAGAASAWGTQSPAGTYVASQATGAARPAIGTSINGLASLDFVRASSQQLVNTADNLVVSGAARYVIAVVKTTAWVAGSGDGGSVLTFRSSTVGGREYNLQYTYGGDSNVYYFTDSVSNNVIDASPGTVPAGTTARLVEWELTAGQAAVVRVDGVARTVAGGNLSGTGEAGGDGFRIGARAAGTFLNGSIGDIYIASGIPSASDKAKLRTYFAAANGVTL